MSEVQNICSNMKRGSDENIQVPFQSQSAQPVFGLCQAPVFPPAASEDSAKVEQGHKKGEHLLMPPKSLVHPLHQALVSAQEKIKSLTDENVTLMEENARLTLRELRTSEALEEMTSIYNQAQKEKEKMEATIKKMEEDFQRKKNDFQDLNRHQLGEISSVRAKWLVAQSQSNWMEEELKESKRELHQGRRQVEREITSLEQSLRIQQEETARLSSLEHHWKEVIRVREENAATKLRESEEKWQGRVSLLEEEMKENRSLVSSLTDQMMSAIVEHKSTITLLRDWSDFSLEEKKWENKCNALEESYRRELTEKEESWQRRVEEMERRNELEKMWLQKEAEWRQKTSSLEEEVRRLTRENTQLQGLAGKKKKRKPWWRRRFKFRRRRQRHEGETLSETVSLLPQSSVK